MERGISPTLREYLVRVSAGGTVWRANQAEAKQYATKREAAAAAKMAGTLHDPTVWAIAAKGDT